MDEHLRRAVDEVTRGLAPGTACAAYGHGVWNGALQPAYAELARTMVSTWIAVLQTQALRTLATGLRSHDAHPELAARPETIAARTADAFAELVTSKRVPPGYLVVEDDRIARMLVRPGDTQTGLDRVAGASAPGQPSAPRTHNKGRPRLPCRCHLIQ